MMVERKTTKEIMEQHEDLALTCKWDECNAFEDKVWFSEESVKKIKKELEEWRNDFLSSLDSVDESHLLIYSKMFDIIIKDVDNNGC